MSSVSIVGQWLVVVGETPTIAFATKQQARMHAVDLRRRQGDETEVFICEVHEMLRAWSPSGKLEDCFFKTSDVGPVLR